MKKKQGNYSEQEYLIALQENKENASVESES